MRILFVLEYFPPYIGGVETLFYHLTRSLKKSGHEVTVITTAHSERNKQNFPYVIEVPTKSRVSFVFLAAKYITKEAQDVDIIHTSSYTAGFITHRVCKSLSKPLILTFHEYWGELWNSLPGLNLLERFLYRSFEQKLVMKEFDAVVAVSNHTKRELQRAGVKESSLSVIYNGIEYENQEAEREPIKSSSEDEFRLLFFGRCGNSKGLNLLVDAMNTLTIEPKIKLDIVSDLTTNRLGRRLQGRINKLKDTVTLRGHMTSQDLNELISRVDAVIIPSYAEGFCFAAVESQAAGKGIIHSGRGALGEVITDKYIRFDEQNAHSIVEAIYKGKNNEWNSSEHRSFRLEDTIGAYIKLYENLLKK